MEAVELAWASDLLGGVVAFWKGLLSKPAAASGGVRASARLPAANICGS